MTTIDFNQLCTQIGENNVYMIIGHGSKNQFRDLRKIKGIINKISKEIPENSFLLYFGDYPDKKNPDIGYLFKLLSDIRDDIIICMIQIDDAKGWGSPWFCKICLLAF